MKYPFDAEVNNFILLLNEKLAGINQNTKIFDVM
jgi:hypothetical protein